MFIAALVTVAQVWQQLRCASKAMLKILQARLQRYVNRELPGVPAGFRKGRGARDQIANIFINTVGPPHLWVP